MQEYQEIEFIYSLSEDIYMYVCMYILFYVFILIYISHIFLIYLHKIHIIHTQRKVGLKWLFNIAKKMSMKHTKYTCEFCWRMRICFNIQ